MRCKSFVRKQAQLQMEKLDQAIAVIE